MNNPTIDELEKRIEELEKKIIALTSDLDEVTGVLIDMTISLAPIVEDWIKNRKKEPIDNKPKMYV